MFHGLLNSGFLYQRFDEAQPDGLRLGRHMALNASAAFGVGHLPGGGHIPAAVHGVPRRRVRRNDLPGQRPFSAGTTWSPVRESNPGPFHYE